MARRKANIDDMLNMLENKVVYARLKNLALNLFEWSGLPEGIKPEYIERLLYLHGHALFFKDGKNGFMCLPCSPSSRVNIYGDPVDFNAFGFNYNERYTLDNSVWIKNNLIMSPTDEFIKLYTVRIAEIERTIDVNVKGQKTPYIIACDSKDLLTVTNMYDDICGNRPVIFADKSLNMESFNVFPSLAPYVADQLADLRHDITNEVLTFLGINNANTDKRERLVTDEVNSNNDYITKNADYMLESRKTAAAEINKMFNLSVSVDIKGGDDVVKIHDDNQGDN